MMYEARNAILKQGFPSIVLIVTQLLVGISQIVYSYKKVDLIPVRDISCRFI